jgi:hypothetical protein
MMEVTKMMTNTLMARGDQDDDQHADGKVRVDLQEVADLLRIPRGSCIGVNS